MPGDSYKTIAAPSQGSYSEKRSRFLSFAFPVATPGEAMQHINNLRREYYDARHVCWAYSTGPDGSAFRSNDDGEPSSTAGKPILGRIRAAELTNILVVVVRYFGGIELGVGGLIGAYRTAAAEAIAAAETIERTVNQSFDITFPYPLQNAVMRILKEEGPAILSRRFEAGCTIAISIRRSLASRLQSRLEALGEELGVVPRT
ncbi:MAG: YigZ family protein [Tannerellaceae bacterium]|jgi:uncharacterized YigZ family protein|nr:YigZ family protein [Tannerellaceae bacterium]